MNVDFLIENGVKIAKSLGINGQKLDQAIKLAKPMLNVNSMEQALGELKKHNINGDFIDFASTKLDSPMANTILNVVGPSGIDKKTIKEGLNKLKMGQFTDSNNNFSNNVGNGKINDPLSNLKNGLQRRKGV